MSTITISDTICPWCNSGHALPDKQTFTQIDKKLRPVEHYSCGTEVSRYYSKGKRRAVWIKTCRLSSVARVS